MRNTASLLLATCLTTCASISNADWILRQATLADLSKAHDPNVFVKSNTSVTNLLTVNSLPLASLTFNGYRSSFGQSLTTPKDWSSYNMVHAKVTNKENRAIVFKFIVQLTSDINNYTNAFTGEYVLGALQTRQIVFHLNVDDPTPFGMEYMPPVLTNNYRSEISGTQFRNLRTIYHWRFSSQETLPTRIDLTDLRLIRQSLTFTGMTDRYGQYSDRYWGWKVSNDATLTSNKSKELTWLSANPGPGEQSGTTKVTNPAPTPGKWKIVSISNGRKFLQHPNTRLFWSLGLNGVHDSLSTPVEGREGYFAELPSQSGRFASCYSEMNTYSGPRLSYSFRKQNLMIKHGDNYLPAWLDMTRKRLASWGVNTVTIDSHSSLRDGKVPHVLDLGTNKFARRLTVLKPAGTLPDPFDLSFRNWMVSDFTPRILPFKSQTALMGAFVDNEMPWGTMNSLAERYNIPISVLTSASTQPAKWPLINQLMSKYGTISALNSAWGSAFSSFDAMMANRTWKPTTFTTKMQLDFQAFAHTFAYKYFAEVKVALKSAGLPSLYLGSRFADYTTESVSGASASVDVLSFNIYRYASEVNWGYLNSLPRPVIISEFGFGLLAAGMFGGPTPAFGTGERGWRVDEFLRTANSQSNVVGAHWYCFADQPITGRWSDGENAGLGFVDVVDAPYDEMVSTFRNFSSSMYTSRAAGSGASGSESGSGSMPGG